MWKNGKEGNTEGRRSMEGKDGRRETGDGRREMIEAEEKNGVKEKGGDAASLQGAPRGHLAEV